MADIVDLAQNNIQEITSMDTGYQFSSPSEVYCIDCGIEIPKKRRSIGGVKRCIDCAELEERKK